MAGLVAIPYQAAYTAAKFGLTGLVYSLRYELKARASSDTQREKVVVSHPSVVVVAATGR